MTIVRATRNAAALAIPQQRVIAPTAMNVRVTPNVMVA